MRGLVLCLTGCQAFFPLETAPATDGGVDVLEDVRHIFLTSTRYTGALGGIAGADERCAAHAAAAGLTGTYLAWLSAANDSPANRMTHHPGPYRTIGEAPIADHWDDLTDGMIANPIRNNELGEVVFVERVCLGGEVWSNTRAMLEVDSCADWTVGNLPELGTVGSNTQTTAA
jgi:hypothetical protein